MTFLTSAMADAGAMTRRLVHLATPTFLVYYFLPSPLWSGGPTRELGLLAFLAAVLVFEAVRLWRGLRVPGMRKYELNQMSAAAWAAIALTFAFLLFPFEYAAPVICGMAWVDPLIATVRRTKWYPYLPFAAHLSIMVTGFALLTPFTIEIILAGLTASVLAIAAESYKSKYVDDDFLMIVAPLLGLAAVLYLA